MAEPIADDGQQGLGGEWEELVQSAPGTPMGTFLRRFWQPIGVSTDVDVGCAATVKVLNENYTLYRGMSGKPHLVDARCAHRGTLLHTGWVEDECIRCRYHGWVYDGTGQCVEMPAEEANFPAKVSISGYPARDYCGIIFAFLGEGAPPEFPRKPEMERSYGGIWASTQVWPCNWFQRIENSMDAVHVSFVHQESALGESLSYSIPEISYEETGYGIKQTATRAADNIRISDFSLPNCNHIVVPTYLPGVEYSARHPWSDLFNYFIPIDDEHTACYTMRSAPVPVELVDDLNEWFDQTDQYNPADFEDEIFQGIMPDNRHGDTSTALVNAQDYVVQVGQGAIADRSRERLGKSDEGIILLRKIFRRELAAIRKGEPGNIWNNREGFARLPVPPGVPSPPDPDD
jgi:phenylpropionate dioxygenase-like ring-hydroxylating dioxygenase large terminal subunit